MYELNPTAVTATLKGSARRRAWTSVSANVWYLGATSLFTDVSSEMVTSVLPVFVVVNLHATPITFGIIDGLYQGVAAVVRLAAACVADRVRGYKSVAFIGYAFSAICKLGLLFVGSAWTWLLVIIVGDRLGKGVRTAPRDALIAMSSPREQLATAFGVHRALDAAGAMLGPVVAFGLLALVPGRFDVVFMTSFWIAIVGVAILLLFVQGAVPGDAVRPSSARIRTGLELFGNRRFRAVLIVATTLSCMTISDSFLYLVVQESFGLNAAIFPLFYVATPFCYFLLAGPIGTIADRVGPSRIFIAGHVTLLILYAVLFRSTIGPITPIVCVGLLGTYYTSTDGIVAAIGSAILPADVRGSGLALIATGTSGGRFAASLTFGAMWTWWGKETAMLLFGGALCGGLGLAWWYFRGLGRVDDTNA